MAPLLQERPEALADYDRAIRTSPRYCEPHLVRADPALELGDEQAALAGCSYALELDDDLDIRANLELATAARG